MLANQTDGQVRGSQSGVKSGQARKASEHRGIKVGSGIAESSPQTRTNSRMEVRSGHRGDVETEQVMGWKSDRVETMPWIVDCCKLQEVCEGVVTGAMGKAIDGGVVIFNVDKFGVTNMSTVVSVDESGSVPDQRVD